MRFQIFNGVKPKPVLNSKFEISEEEAAANEEKEIIRLENEAIIREEQKEKEKERASKNR